MRKLVFLKVLVDATLHPYDASHDDESHRRENHQTVVDVTVVIAPLGYHLIAEQCAAAEQLAEESDNHEYDGISESVAHAVKKCRPGLVAHGERLETSHKDTVGDDKTDEDRQLFGRAVGISLEHLVDNHHQSRYHHELDDDADVGGDGVAYERHYNIGECEYRNHRDAHYDGRFEFGGDGEHRADAEYLYYDGPSIEIIAFF